jgi:hypothetical protein
MSVRQRRGRRTAAWSRAGRPPCREFDEGRHKYCADAAQADYIVTVNKRDFPDAPYGVTRVVSAGELLDRISPSKSDRNPLPLVYMLAAGDRALIGRKVDFSARDG